MPEIEIVPVVDVDVLTSELSFPEGPVALDDGSVLVVEIQGGRFTRVYPDGTLEVLAHTGGGPNGAAIGPDGHAYLCNNGGITDPYALGSIQRVELTTGTVTTVYDSCDGRHLLKPNDIVFDSTGGFWFSDIGARQGRTYVRGSIYYAQPDGSAIREVLHPLDHPNGVGLSPDGTRLYYAETMVGRLFFRRLSAPGVVADLVSPPPPFQPEYLLCGLPDFQLLDSLAVDRDGNVAVGTLLSGRITVVAPDGSWVRQLTFPESLFDPYVTNVCFGGLGDRTAYVTMSQTGKLVSFAWPEFR